MRELSTQDPRCSTGGIPIASHTSRRPAPAFVHHLRAQITEFARGMSRAACDHYQDVVGNQLADGVDDAFVLG